MCNCLRLTGIATLLIGFHLLNANFVETKVEPNLLNNKSSHQLAIAVHGNSSQKLTLLAQSSQGFEPSDNGGPKITRGSGTR